MDDISKIAIVINPVARNSAGHRVRPILEEVFLKEYPARYRCEIIETETKAHAGELGASLDADLVVVVGGDGTAHDVAGGILTRPRAERPAFTTIPFGSGNDYSKTLGIAQHPAAAARALLDGTRVTTDVGCCNGTFYLETLSFGIDAAIAAHTIELRKTVRTHGALLYAQAAIPAILKDLKTHHARYVIDGEEHEDDLLMFAVQNGFSYGGGFVITPHASLRDGYLDICTAHNVGRLKALYYLALILKGKHEGKKHIRTFKARNISLVFDHPLIMQCDGEPQIGTQYEIAVVPAALDIMVPPGSPVLNMA